MLLHTSERDEHGMNALYHQMTASLASLNGYWWHGHKVLIRLLPVNNQLIARHSQSEQDATRLTAWFQQVVQEPLVIAKIYKS
jgi:hypothetical protein